MAVAVGPPYQGESVVTGMAKDPIRWGEAARLRPLGAVSRALSGWEIEALNALDASPHPN